METRIVNIPSNEIELKERPLSTRLSVIDDGIRKKYLARLSEMQIAPIKDLPPLENDLISNVRLYHVTEMVYQKGESVTDKFTTVFNTLATYNASVFILIDSDGKTANYYLGVRNNESDESSKKRSTVTLGDTLKQTFIGHFPGVKIENEDRKKIAELSQKISTATNVASVSVVGNTKSEKDMTNEQFVQGLEKLSLAMSGRAFTGLIIADNQMPQNIHALREFYQELYSKLSPYQKIQISDNTSTSTSRAKSFLEMDTKKKAATGVSTALSMAGVIGGSIVGGPAGGMIGGQIGGQFNGFINSLAPNEQVTTGNSTTTSSSYENKAVTDMLALLDQLLKKTNEYDSYGMWNVAGYFVSDDMSTAEIAASNYSSLMNGENTGREVSAVNSWRFNNDAYTLEDFNTLTTYLSRYAHPQFVYYNDVNVSAATAVSGKELGLHLGLPRACLKNILSCSF